MIQILLVEDDANMGSVIKYYLAKEGIYDVKLARTIQEAIQYSADRYDIILLDIMLPDGNGVELCEQLRAYHQCPIIFISALSENDTIISALHAGGDDYITKPFDNSILKARIDACLRRVSLDKTPADRSVLHYQSYALDLNKHVFTDGVTTVHLMQYEFSILALLMQNRGRCLHSEAIYKAIWGNDSVGDARTVVVHIYNLRRKIEKDHKNPQLIRNVWGKGYCFDPDGLISEG